MPLHVEYEFITAQRRGGRILFHGRLGRQRVPAAGASRRGLSRIEGQQRGGGPTGGYQEISAAFAQSPCLLRGRLQRQAVGQLGVMVQWNRQVLTVGGGIDLDRQPDAVRVVHRCHGRSPVGLP